MCMDKMTKEENAIAGWLSAALDDPNVCDKMKEDINNWFATFSLEEPVSATYEKTVKKTPAELEEHMENKFKIGDQCYTRGCGICMYYGIRINYEKSPPEKIYKFKTARGKMKCIELENLPLFLQDYLKL